MVGLSSIEVRRLSPIRLVTLLVMILAVFAVVACTSGNSDVVFSKIDSSPTILDLSSFDDSGFKKAREYDVVELPGATAAYMGYFTPVGSEPVQYELRVYTDHASAVDNGVSYAEEVTGEDALLRSVDVRWEEGTKDRRGGGAFSDGLTPLYGDFAVHGNVVLHCEGRDSIQSLDRCKALLQASGIGVEG